MLSTTLGFWRTLTLIAFLFVCESGIAESQIQVVRIDPLQELLSLDESQVDAFLDSYRAFVARKNKAVRRARLKARGSEDASRRISKATKKENKRFDGDIEELLTAEQFAIYIDSREQIVGSLADRRTGFSNSSVPNPGGLLSEPGVYGATN